MVDKADFRADRRLHFTPEFKRIFADAIDIPFGNSEKARMWKPSRYYEKLGDFSEYDLPVMLHLDCKMTKARDHKIEILGTGDRTYSEMREILGRVFVCEPENLALLRADLTADVPDVPVPWFKEKTYVAGKQTTREIGTIQPIPYMAIRQGRAETLYAGVKPNQMRIYDKVGEQVARYKSMVRREMNDAKKGVLEYAAQAEAKAERLALLPTFEQMHGYGPDRILTRVERQVHGRDLEKLNLKTMYSLKTADTLEPFKAIRFFAEDASDELSIEAWGWRDWMAGHHMRTMQAGMGTNEFRKMMQAELGSNFHREWNKFAPFLRMKSKIVGITSGKLQEEYIRSTYRQMAA